MTITITIENTGHLPVTISDVDTEIGKPDTFSYIRSLAVGEKLVKSVWKTRYLKISEPIEENIEENLESA